MRFNVFFERSPDGFCASLRLFCDFAQPIVFALRHRKGSTTERGNGFVVESCGSSKLLRQLSSYLAAMDTVFFVLPVAALFFKTSTFRSCMAL
jgi:hypothetical protein